jgi:hypothetical protein
MPNTPVLTLRGRRAHTESRAAPLWCGEDAPHAALPVAEGVGDANSRSPPALSRGDVNLADVDGGRRSLVGTYLLNCPRR